MADWYEKALLKEKGIEGYGSEEAKQEYLADLGDPLDHPMWADPEECQQHPMMEAFRQLREEDKTNLELATMYKDEGNEWLKGGLEKMKKAEAKERLRHLHESRGCYEHALTFIKTAEDNNDSDGIAVVATSSGDTCAVCERDVLKSQIISNKALVALHLRNFGECKKDARLSVDIWKYNCKGWFRMCKAYQSVRRFDDCVAACDEALDVLSGAPTVDAPGVKQIETLKKESLTSLDSLKRVEKARLARIQAEEQRWRYAWRAMAVVGATLGYPYLQMPAQLEVDSEAHLPRCLHANNRAEIDIYAAMNADRTEFTQDVGIVMPLVFLYPQHNQVDIVREASPMDLLSEHLQTMFPGTPGSRPSWDVGKSVPEYVHTHLVVYVCLNASPIITTEETWVSACRERRDAQGHNGAPAAARASARMTAREEAHMRAADNRAIVADPSSSKKEESNMHDFAQLTRAKNWLEVQPQLSIQTVVAQPAVVLPGGVPSFICYPRKSSAHHAFLAGLKKDGVTVAKLELE